MKSIVLNLTIAILFSFAIAGIPPSQSSSVDLIFVLSFVTFYLVSFFLQRHQCVALWNRFGLTTFFCYMFSLLWFWHGAMARGLWYPSAPEIMQMFTSIDGESSYDAAVSNLFLVLWPIAIIVFVPNSPNKTILRSGCCVASLLTAARKLWRY
ncbi:hypothetical protein QUF90_15590 [Desulfococcaceae bacterium HSG9]|nr:hypothetical protein [Desulfococcaceae bacterium HSG9]